MVPTHKNKQGARVKEEPKKPASLVPELVIDPIREEPEHESSEYEEVETEGEKVQPIELGRKLPIYDELDQTGMFVID